MTISIFGTSLDCLDCVLVSLLVACLIILVSFCAECFCRNFLPRRGELTIDDHTAALPIVVETEHNIHPVDPPATLDPSISDPPLDMSWEDLRNFMAPRVPRSDPIPIPPRQQRDSSDGHGHPPK